MVCMLWPSHPFLDISNLRHVQLWPQGTAKNKTLTRQFNLWRTGVTTDGFTPKGAVIMAVSVLLYGIIQVCFETCTGACGHACHVLAINCQCSIFERPHPAAS